MHDWYVNHDNVTQLGRWLIDNDKLESPAVEGLQYFYEKPWKWTLEWEQMNEAKMPTLQD